MVQAAGIEALNSDWDLLEEAARGDSRAWLELVEKFQTKLINLAWLISGSVQSAEDIVQETFAAAMRSLPKNRNGTVRGYLNTIAYRLCLKEIKRTRRQIDFGDLELAASNLNQFEALAAQERAEAVAEAISSLDMNHRLVLILRFYGEHTFEEIAELLQIPVGTAKSRLFHAVKRCRQELKRKGIIE